MAGTTSNTWTGDLAYYPPVQRYPIAEPPPREEQALLVHNGPVECSSSKALSVLPEIIWDVNGYYRELGVLPTATRKQLRLAYQARDGQSSARLTYIMGQLLNPAIRFDYDCTPLGELFIDRYVQEMIMNRIKSQKAERITNLFDAGVDLDLIDEEALERDIASAMGFDVGSRDDDDDTPLEVVDESPPEGQDDGRPAKFMYSYYLWSTTDAGTDLGRLTEWQRLLVDALAKRGISTRFAVGIHGRWQRVLHGLVGYRDVFFLSKHEEPSQELAEVAVEAMIAAR